MDTSAMVAAIDDEIALLGKVRELLGGRTAPMSAPKRRGLSPEARRRISEAQKRRWAAAKKAAK